MPEKKPKPQILDVAVGLLDKEQYNNLSAFVAWMKENKMTPSFMTTSRWVVSSKSKNVCHVNLCHRTKTWGIAHCHITRHQWFAGYEKYIIDDEMIEFIHRCVQGNVCQALYGGENNCGATRNKDKVVIGKRFDFVCQCWPLVINNPVGKELELEKRFILTIKQIITDVTAK